MPSEKMRNRFETTVTACPDNWTFQVITEDGHNGRVISPRDPGTWYICCYQEPVEGNTLLEFTLSYNDSGRYMLRVKADTNSCPFEDDEHLRSENALNGWRNEFMGNPPFDTSTWNTVNREGQQSITIVKKECRTFEEMADMLLYSIDDVEQNGWV